MAADQDTVIAQLMSMGFQPEAIKEYQVAMETSTEGFSMQAATEWFVVVEVYTVCVCVCVSVCVHISTCVYTHVY